MALLAVTGLTALTLGACEDDDVVGVVTEQEYTGDFQALNASGVAGIADVFTDDLQNEFEVSIEAGNMAPEITHAQHIHAAGECPTMADDANGDGYLDVVEGLPSYGGILLPLDSDLTDQASGAFPTADASGLVDYRNGTTWNAMVESIRGEDTDIYVEVDDEEVLAPRTRTVVLHGVAPSTELPSSVQSLADLPAEATLPVACAELVNIPIVDS